MPAKKTKATKVKQKMDESMMVMPPEMKVEKKKDDEDFFGEALDPAEEKMLDRILMAVVVFILAWLGLSILLVLRGYACSQWISGSFICAGL